MANDAAVQITAGTVLKNFIRILPGLVILAATLSTGSCGGSGFFGLATGSPTVTKTATATTPTITGTATPTPGAALFVTNFADGTLSAFSRNTSTGALTFAQNIGAGAAPGPMGLAVNQADTGVYVTNATDSNIYEFSLNLTSGTPVMTPMPTPAIGNGTKSVPQQIVLNPSGTLSGNQFAWVAAANGTINLYSINSSTGQLSFSKTAASAGAPFSPFGMQFVKNGSSAGYLFVTDIGGGNVYWYSVKSDGTLTKINAILSLGRVGGSPSFVAYDASPSISTSPLLYVDDKVNGVVSVIALNLSTGAMTLLTPTTPPSFTANMPFGMALITNQFLFTANENSASLWSFPVGVQTVPLPLNCTGGGLSVPTGFVPDSTNAYAYVTNQGNGTVSQFSLSGLSTSTPCPGFVNSYNTESPAHTAQQPFGLALSN